MAGQYKCSKCGKKCFNELTLWNHGFECGNENKQPTCNLCKKTFICLSSRYRHLKGTHSCSKCGDRFITRLSLRNHLQRFHKKHGQYSKQNLYRCNYCSLTFNAHGLRLSHTKLMHKDTTKTEGKDGTRFDDFTDDTMCLHCKLSLPDTVQLLDHIKTCHGQLCCSDCGIFFENMADRWDHLFSIHNIQLHCAFCHLSFDSEADTQKHQKEKHLCDIQRCAVCKEGILQSVLTDHLRDDHGLPSVDGDDVQQCKVCEMFVTKSSFSAHVKVEHGLIYDGTCEKYVCPQCGVKFRLWWPYKNHIDHAHTSDKMAMQYKCSKCGKRYYSELTLWNHEFECGNENKQPTCNLCKKTFARVKTRNIHLKQHSSEMKNNLFCSDCGLRFCNKVNLHKHIQRVHKEHRQLPRQGVYCCKFCYLTFNTFGLRLSHTKLMHKKDTAKTEAKDGTRFEDFTDDTMCLHCKLSLPRKDALVNHIKSLHSVLCCLDCGIFFENEVDRLDHLYSKHNIQLHCAFCLLSFDTDAERQKHQKDKHLCDIQRCAVCKEGILQSVLVDHLRDDHELPAVNGDDVQQCKVCQKFVTKASHATHIKVEHGLMYDVQQCKLCQKVFTKSDYVAHFKVEHGIVYDVHCERYGCPHCGVQFRVLGRCKHHIDRYHVPGARVAEVPKECHICKKVFMKKCDLNSHIKHVHSGRIFLCDQCGAMFKQRYHLTEHLMRHNEDRPYKCNECPKSFVQSSGLKTHMLSHSGTRSVLCSICGATLKDQCNLKEHMAKHTGHRPYHCLICGAGFIFPSRLKAHMEKGKHESH